MIIMTAYFVGILVFFMMVFLLGDDNPAISSTKKNKKKRLDGQSASGKNVGRTSNRSGTSVTREVQSRSGTSVTREVQGRSGTSVTREVQGRSGTSATREAQGRSGTSATRDSKDSKTGFVIKEVHGIPDLGPSFDFGDDATEDIEDILDALNKEHPEPKTHFSCFRLLREKVKFMASKRESLLRGQAPIISNKNLKKAKCHDIDGQKIVFLDEAEETLNEEEEEEEEDQNETDVKRSSDFDLFEVERDSKHSGNMGPVSIKRQSNRMVTQCDKNPPKPSLSKNEREMKRSGDIGLVSTMRPKDALIRDMYKESDLMPSFIKRVWSEFGKHYTELYGKAKAKGYITFEDIKRLKDSKTISTTSRIIIEIFLLVAASYNKSEWSLQEFESLEPILEAELTEILCIITRKKKIQVAKYVRTKHDTCVKMFELTARHSIIPFYACPTLQDMAFLYFMATRTMEPFWHIFETLKSETLALIKKTSKSGTKFTKEEYLNTLKEVFLKVYPGDHRASLRTGGIEAGSFVYQYFFQKPEPYDVEDFEACMRKLGKSKVEIHGVEGFEFYMKLKKDAIEAHADQLEYLVSIRKDVQSVIHEISFLDED